MIKRVAEERLKYLAKTFKAVAVVGPRQSGKTTLCKMLFPDWKYVSLENLDSRQFAQEDPKGFLAQYKSKVIIDEAQLVPELFSYLQSILDASTEKGQFVLSGSNNFLLQESISQSLAGRIGYLNLLPFSLNELENATLEKNDTELLIKGFYPPIYDQEIPPSDWFPNYRRTYIERDVRQIKSVSNLLLFEKFLSLLAGRTAQELNFTALANAVGIDVKTAQSWVGILQSSFIVFLLKPHFKNFNKTISKRPKLYFTDVGLASHLLRIKNAEQLEQHPLKGALYENLMVGEVYKKLILREEANDLFYYRDKTGREVDLIVDSGVEMLPIELKATMTARKDLTKNLEYWMKLTSTSKGELWYSGDEIFEYSSGISIKNWRKGLKSI